MVWGRIPATAILLSAFPKAQFMLYMDTDAMLSSASFTPSMMYHALSYDGKGANATFNYLQPSLIVNKPLTGWLCSQCQDFGLGHGCFNSGALLWRRSKGMELVLRRWWESRLNNGTQNVIREENGTTYYFHGWWPENPSHINNADKMSEQNRLMYIFNNDADVRKKIWPVPREISEVFNSSSCPNAVNVNYTPCLQNDFAGVQWDPSTPACFINHYADRKEAVHEVLEMMVHGKKS
jgi:hypothetical protein